MFNLKIMFNFYKYKRKLNCSSITKNGYCSSSASSSCLKILFFGTDGFSLPSLQALHNKMQSSNPKISKLGVVTSFKSPANPVKYYATQNHTNIELYKWPINYEICRQYTLGIVVSFGHLIPENIISSFPFGMINVHASLLPRWRGAAPIIHAISHGDLKTGVSIMKIEPKKFDIGDILYQKECLIDPDVLMPQLHQELANVGANLLIKTITNSPECFKEFQAQNENLVTYAPKIQPAFYVVNWSMMSAKQIYNLYRSLYSYKNLCTNFQSLIIKIIKLNYQTNKNTLENCSHSPGFIEYSKHRQILKVYGNDNDYVEIHQLKVEGKKVINAHDFNNGFLKKHKIEQRYFK